MPQFDPRRNNEFAEILESGNFIAPSGIDESVYEEKKENRLATAIRKGWQMLPKPVRATICILVCILLIVPLVLYLCWLVLPQISPETAFRMEERKHLVGPMEIRETIELSGKGYDRLILAEDAMGVAVYRYHSTNVFQEESFSYHEKKTSITFAIVPIQSSTNRSAEIWTSVIAVFDSHPKAVRAQLKLALYTEAMMSGNGEVYDSYETWTCVLEAQRENQGYFLFHVTSGEDDDTLRWAWKTRCLQEFMNGGYDHRSYSYTLCFYDVNGDVVMQKTGIL